MELNQRQQEAVDQINGPLLVLAGAGTGKTRVLTHRIYNIVSKNFASCNNILAVTFTNKAAKEMKDRLYHLIGDDAYFLSVGTFHSIALTILRQNIQLLNTQLDRNFTIIADDDQIKLIKAIINDFGLDKTKYIAKTILYKISKWKDEGLYPDEVENTIDSNAYNKTKELKIIDIYKEYSKKLLIANVIDFDDFLFYCNKILIDNPDILSYYQNKYKYILVDEYQDTNKAQLLWVRLLANKHQNICCVGDDDQSIYSWRGAQISNILQFTKYFPEAKFVTLDQNYRSTDFILRNANSVISHNKQRHEKKLWANKANQKKVEILAFSNGFDEAKFIGKKIASIINDNTLDSTNKNIAILVRTNVQMLLFEEVFATNKIDYSIVGGLKFYERMEIRDLISYIKLITNLHDDLCLERIINVPKRSIGKTTVAKIKQYANENDSSMLFAIKQMIHAQFFPKKTHEALREFINMIEDIKDHFASNDPASSAKYTIKKIGYSEYISNGSFDDSKKRLDNINQLLLVINRFSQIEDFIEHSSLVIDEDLKAKNEIDIDAATSQDLEKKYNVTLMTLHAAKGLEYDIVFLPGFEEGIFPHRKILNQGKNDEDDVENMSGDIFEERRLAYVGITRAKNELYISYANSRVAFVDGNRIYEKTTPSRFIAELDVKSCSFHNAAKSLYNLNNYANSNNSLNRNHSHLYKTNKSIKNQSAAKYVSPKTNNNNINNNNIETLSKFNIGDQIKHTRFGLGVVVKIDLETIHVAFKEVGVKLIKENFLEKI